jgi:hypothetical protein
MCFVGQVTQTDHFLAEESWALAGIDSIRCPLRPGRYLLVMMVPRLPALPSQMLCASYSKSRMTLLCSGGGEEGEAVGDDAGWRYDEARKAECSFDHSPLGLSAQGGYLELCDARARKHFLSLSEERDQW